MQNGLYKNKKSGIWEIDKRINGHRLRRSCGTTDETEANLISHRLIAEKLEEIANGKVDDITFEQAAILHLQKNKGAPSIDADISSIRRILPYIASVRISQIHQSHIDKFVESERLNYKSTTLNRTIVVTSGILKSCARRWRNPETNNPYLRVHPLLSQVEELDKNPTRPISDDENEKLMVSLNKEYRDIWTFALNTGLREQNIAGLRWEWEVQIPTIPTTAFLIPAFSDASIAAVRRKKGAAGLVANTKNRKDFLLILNQKAFEVLEKWKGRSDEYVFVAPHGGKRSKLNATHFKKAIKDNNLTGVSFHSSRAKFATLLRMLGVSMEDRKLLIGHSDKDVTTGYSWPDIKRLYDILEMLGNVETGQSATFLKLVKN